MKTKTDEAGRTAVVELPAAGANASGWAVLAGLSSNAA